LKRHVFVAEMIHTGDAPIPVLSPGTGETRQARLWTYVRDDRPHGGNIPPAAWYCYSPDRNRHPSTEAPEELSRHPASRCLRRLPSRLRHRQGPDPGCWAHARRHFYDIHAQRPSAITRLCAADHRLALRNRGRYPRGSPPET